MSEKQNNAPARTIVEGMFGAESNAAANLGEGKLNKYNNIATRMFHTGVLTPREMIFPAIGQFATQLLKALEQYRKLYFVNVLKIDMSYVVLIEMLIGIYDVMNNPLMGIAYDRTRTRWGKARPYILLGAIPFFASTAAMYSGALFLGDKAGNDPKKIIFVFVMLFIQETFSTIYNIPRDNMLTLQTVNPKDRITVGLLNEYIGNIGAQLVFIIFLPIMELNNKGYISFPMPALFAIMAGAASFIGAAGNMAMAANCKERIMLQEKPAPVLKSLFYILKNKYLLRNFVANFAVSWWADGGYKWDVVTQQEIFGGSVPSAIAYMPYNILDSLSVTFIPKFQKLFKNNNKKAVIVLRSWDMLCNVGMVLFGCPNVDKKWLMVLIYGIFYGLNGFNNGPSNVFEAELGREINDYTEYMTGERPDGTIGILTGLITKITAPLNSLLTIKLFKWSGYDSTIDMLPWSQGSKTVYSRVFFLFIGIDLFPKFVKVIPYFFYDLTGEKREKMYIELNERRALIASERNAEQEQMEEIMEALESEKV